ncbi:Eukaryotic translation initiation factor 5A [Entamoeba marina]
MRAQHQSITQEDSVNSVKQAYSLHVGEYLYIDTFPCRITELTKTKGKVGTPKAYVTCVDIYTKQKYEVTLRGLSNVEVFEIYTEDYELIGINDEYLSLLNPNGEVRDDLKLPSGEFGKKIKNRFDNDISTLCVVTTFDKMVGVTDFKNL